MARLLPLAALAGLAACALAPPAPAQRAALGREWFEDHQNGYKLRYPVDWRPVPVQPSESGMGVVAQMQGRDLATRAGNASVNFSPMLRILRLDPAAVVTGSEREAGEAAPGGAAPPPGRRTVEQFLKAYSSIDPQPGPAEEIDWRGLQGRHQTFLGKIGGRAVPVLLDTWTLHLSDFDIVLLYEIPEEHGAKWRRVFADSARSFTRIERQAAVQVTDEGDYAQVLASIREEAGRTPGWRVLEVPSKRYILTTSSTDQEFLESVIERLERSRDLFERDFPPASPIEHVSLVRVCSSLDEFHLYGKTGGGVAGWFNPQSTELVIVDFRDIDRKMSYAVMTHEAFHQYCHFLFDQSEAHRWFDEGHGDYYGAFRFEGRRALASTRMPGGLDRVQEIKEMLRSDTYAPIGKHLRFNHRDWQQQGPSGTSCYAQSWSIIYMLRQGMLGEVPRRLWRPEYGEIVPNYMRVLHEGFQKAYAEARRRAAAEGRELSAEELERDRPELGEERKQQIWDAAIAASWGQIDLDEFERNWKEYVLRHL